MYATQVQRRLRALLQQGAHPLPPPTHTTSPPHIHPHTHTHHITTNTQACCACCAGRLDLPAGDAGAHQARAPGAGCHLRQRGHLGAGAPVSCIPARINTIVNFSGKL